MPKYFTRLPLWLCVLLALTVGVLSSTVEAAPAAQPPKAPRPTHWWPADGTARDRAGTDDGQLLNGVTYTSRDCAYADGVRVASEGECER